MNLIVTGIIGLIAIFLDVATSTSFINFGAFTGDDYGKGDGWGGRPPEPGRP